MFGSGILETYFNTYGNFLISLSEVADRFDCGCMAVMAVDLPVKLGDNGNLVPLWVGITCLSFALTQIVSLSENTTGRSHWTVKVGSIDQSY